MNGEVVVAILLDHAGAVLVMIGFCGALKENEGVPVCVALFSFGLSVTEIFTVTNFSISYGAGAGKLSAYPLILFCRVSILYEPFPVRSVIDNPGILGVVYDRPAHPAHAVQATVTEIVPLFTHS